MTDTCGTGSQSSVHMHIFYKYRVGDWVVVSTAEDDNQVAPYVISRQRWEKAVAQSERTGA